MVVACFIAILAIGFVIRVCIKVEKEASAQEKEEMRKKAAEKEAEKIRKNDYDKKQELVRSQLETISTQAALALKSIPTKITSANRALDKAEAEYEEGVFAPFWDAVEVALGCLTEYENCIQTLTKKTTEFSAKTKALATQPPSFVSNSTPIPDASVTVERLKKIVRRAQKVPDFAKIYEMRRTNSLLVAGFSNLGTAINNMGFRIQNSITGLAQTLDSAITSMSQQNAEYYRDSLLSIETLRDQLASNAESLSEQLASDSQAQREHEGKIEEMTDNMQRRRRPYIEEYRDGQY